MNRNIFQQQITPIKPKVLGEERVYVYIPSADGGGGKGLASFNQRDFSSPRGHVSLKWPMEMLVQDLADPTIRPSLTKVLPDEFNKTNITRSVTNTVTGVTYNSETAEIALKRDNRDAFSRPELVMLDINDFDVNKLSDSQYNRYSIKKKNPLNNASIVKLDIDDFLYENEVVKINWPYAHNHNFGLVKIRSDGIGSLGFDVDNNLQVDLNALKNNMFEDLAIRPTYTSPNSNYYDAETGLAKRDSNGNTLLDITKFAVGLGDVENRTFASRTYEEFGTTMKNYFSNQFGLKLDKSYWNGPSGLFRDWNPSTIDRATVQRWFERLEAEDDSIWSSLRTIRLFLGVFITIDELEATYPANEELKKANAYILETNTYWAIREIGGIWEWFDTGNETLNFFDYVETDADSLKPNAPIANVSVGTSGKWIQSDHVHPSDPTKLDTLFIDDATIDIVTTAPTDNDFHGALVDKNLEINIPYIRTAQYLHNWKNNPTNFTQNETSNEYYWGGSAEEFAELNLENIPNGAFIHVDDGELLEPGYFVTEEQLNESGLLVSNDIVTSPDRIVIVNRNIHLAGVPLTIIEENVVGEFGERRKISALNFGEPWGSLVPESHRMAITIPGENGRTLSHRIFTSNRIIQSDVNGNLTTSNITPDNIIVKTDNLTANRVVKSIDKKTIQTWNSGLINNAPIVSTGTNDIKTLELSGNRIVKTDTFGGLQAVNWVEPNIVKSSSGDTVNVLNPNKIAMTGNDNTIYSWDSGGIVGSMIERGNENGQLRVRTHTNINRIVLTGTNGTIIELPSGTNGQILVSGGSNQPGWIDSPVINTHLPQTVFTSNPSEAVANALTGLAAVILSSAPDEFRNNCIYYY